MKGFFVVAALLLASTFAAAQKADAAFVVGGSFVSDTNGTIIIPPPLGGGTANVTVKSDHHLFFEGALGVRVLDAKAVSLHIRGANRGNSFYKIDRAHYFHNARSHHHAVHHARLRVKFLPGAPVSPWVSSGGGWAHYSLKDAV